MGSVADKILRKAHCPVLVVHKTMHDFVEHEKGRDPVRLRKILACTDFSQHSERTLNYAMALAMEYQAELTLLHVLEDLPKSTDLGTATAEIGRKFQELTPSDAASWCSIKPIVRVGRPYQEIIQLAVEGQVDLIVKGVRGRNAIDVTLFGSNTERVIQLGSSPVLAVH